jgi:tetratricopeptide (TPR) repeat protein
MRRTWGWLAVVALLIAPGTASADWWSLRTDNFHVLGDTSPGRIREVALRLEQFRQVVGLLNPGAVPEADEAPVVVVVFDRDRAYEPFMPRTANGEPVRVGGLFQPGQDVNYITLSFEAGNAAYPTIFHEYSHLLLRREFSDAPVWINEGLAEYYRTFEVTQGGQRANIGRTVEEHLELLRRRRLPFTRFFAIDRDSPEYTESGAEREVLYAQGWAIVHHAIHGESGRRDQLFEFARRVAGGAATASAFRDVYGIELDALEQELRLYVTRRVFDYSTLDLDGRVATALTVEPEPLPEIEAEAWLGDLLAQMGMLDEASARLEAVVEAAPDLAVAHTFLGALRIRQDRANEGLEHLERAFALGTDNETALFRYARMRVEEAPNDPGPLEQAATALERVLALKPSFLEATLLLAYVRSVQEDDLAVRDLLSPVLREDPANHRAALRLAFSLLRLDDLDGGRALLGPVLARSASEGERARARELLTLLAGLQTRRGALIPVFRDVEAGELRAYGIFEAVACRPGRFVFRVRTADTVIEAEAASLDDVDFVAYRPLPGMAIGCGPRLEPEEIYQTWRPDPNTPGDGAAVAIEILPEGFVPAP